MAASVLWMTSVLMATLTISQLNCETLTFTKTREGHPQKMVEIVELMLSQRPNDSDRKGFGIQKVPQGDVPNYEILITPNKNLQELKGSQKIKIFVEAASNDKGDGDKASKEANAEKREKQSLFDVLPLSIETVGLNIEHYQQPGIPIVKINGPGDNDEYPQKDFESYPSKRQTNWGARGDGKSRQPEIKESVIHREPSYVDQNNPYQSARKKEDRPRAPTYDGDYSSSIQNGKRISHQTFVDDFAAPVDEPSRGQNRPSPKRAYDEKPIYEERPSNDRRPVIRETEEPRPSNINYGREEEEYRPSESRNPGYNRPGYERPSNERRPIYREPEETRPNNERYPDYEETRPSNTRKPVYVREPEETRPSKDRNPLYVREPEEFRPPRRPSSISDGYDSRPQDANRPVRENISGYSGFPESYQPDINHHYSKPLQYEPARAFPASPCLNVFKYEGREPEEDRWYGDIYVTTDEVLNGMRLDIRLDRPAEILTNWLAEVKTKDSTHYTLLSLTHKLMPGPPETVRIMVKFNGKKPVPYLKSINLNGRLICPSNRVQKTTTRRPEYENPGDLQTRRTTPPYREGPKRPGSYVEEYESNTKRSTTYTQRTTPLYGDSNRKTTARPPSEHLRPNPNGYENTDLNSFGGHTQKPPSRPSHSGGKQPAAKPSKGQTHNHAHGPSASSKPTPAPSQGSQREIHCGTPSVQPRPLITNGQLTSRGQWPWHVALYKNVGTDLNYFCGGSLINKNYVLTAAHCVTKTYTTKPLDENTLVVYLGKYHLKLWSEGGVEVRQVSKIYVHPEYNSTNFKSDMAVLALSTPVDYTDYIRPICLWDRSNTRIENVEGKEGTVVGWGFDETKKLTEELRQAKMPVIPQETCLWSYSEFYPQFTSNMTYCAGFRNGTSVCNGDSGGGMVFPYKDESGVERWHLRGIVSISPARNDSRICDPTHYVVFTDVAKYLPWLDNFI